MLENIAFFRTKKEKNHRIINIESGGRGELASCPNFFVWDCRYRLRKSEVFFPLADHDTDIHHIMSLRAFILVFISNRPGFRSCGAIVVISDKVVRMLILFASIIWVCLRNYPLINWLPTPITERGNQPATAIKWPSMCLRLDWDSWTRSCNPRFSFHRKLKTSQTENYRIQKFTDSKFHLLIRHDQTGEFLFRICVNGKINPVLKRSGFIAISGTISTSVNLVLLGGQ